MSGPPTPQASRGRPAPAPAPELIERVTARVYELLREELRLELARRAGPRGGL